MNSSCTIVIPCFNESENIEDSLQSMWKYLKEKKDRTWVLVCVDDGSTDDTAQCIRHFECSIEPANHMRFLFVRLPCNQGKGAAIQAGVRASNTDMYGYIDADLSIAYSDAILHALSEMKTHDIVIAQRDTLSHRGYTVCRRVGSQVFRSVTTFFLGLAYKDVQCGFKFFSHTVKPLVLSIKQSRFAFDVEFLARAKKDTRSIKEIIVGWRHHGHSAVRFQDAIRYMLDVLLVADAVQTKRWWYSVYGITSVFVCAILFGHLVWNGFFFSDDFTWLWYGKQIYEGTIHPLTAHMSTFFSPVMNMFYGSVFWVFGVWSPAYFLFGLGVHGIVSLLVGLLTRIVSKSFLVGWVALILFVLAGGGYEPLYWVGANMHSIATLFIAGSVLAAVYAFQEDRISARIPWFILSVSSFLLALGTKEIAIVTPGIFFFLMIFHFRKRVWKQYAWLTILYGCTIIGVSLLYLWYQYMWQQGSVWITSGTFHIDPRMLLRIPLGIFDSMIPLGWMMSSNSAFLLLTVSLSVLGYILYRFRTISGVWFGMMWSVCATLPVLFFNADTWHVLLASRYTYHVRIGVSIVLAIAFVSLIKNNKYIRVAHRFVWVIVAGIVFQFVFMYRTTQTAYPYVYQTGRAMVKASEEIAYIHPDHVYIDFYRPFAQNTAHMVGALYVLSGMLEKDIYFLESVSSTPQSGDVLVKWNDTKNTYDVLSQ